jgi:diguanylate cyclase (GGDEF)-like protein
MVQLEQQNLELLALNERLSVLASTDSLTQVYNRTRFDLLFHESVEVSTRRHTQLSLLIIDLDDFKKVNDKFGHQIGDHVLKESANLLSELVGVRGIVSRWGGEEFAILLPYSDIEQAYGLAESMRSEMSHRRMSKALVSVSISVGVASLHAEESPDSLLMRADNALYYAKNNGRNQVCVADGEHYDPLAGKCCSRAQATCSTTIGDG